MNYFIKKIYNRCREWIDTKIEIKLFTLMQKEGSLQNRILKQEAGKLANMLCIKWLDHRGIMHCQLCPENRSIHKVQSYYLCSKHFDEMEFTKNGFNR